MYIICITEYWITILRIVTDTCLFELEMEFIPEFAVIQGCLLTLQKKLGVLKYLREDEAEKEKINVVVETIIKKVSCFENLDAQDYNKLRQISLFLVLNSDLEVNVVLSEDSYCGHLVDSCPTLSKDTLIKLMCEPLFSENLFELIIFSPTCLCIELIEIATKYLEKSSQILIPQTASIFVRASYAKLVSLNSDSLKNDSSSHVCANHCAALKLMDSYSKLLEYFADPKRSQGDHFKNNLSEGLAYLLRSSLDVVTSCLKFYLSPIQLTEEQINIYKMNLKFDYSKWHKISENEYYNVMHDQLYSILVVQIAYVTVDVWLDWAELDSKFVSNYSVQKDIAECMFKCYEVIHRVQEQGMSSNLWKALLPMLSSMARKPRDEDDEIEDADIILMLKKISDKSCTQKKWLVALLKKFDILCTQDCIESINKNINVIDFEVAFLFLQNILTSVKKDPDIEFSENVKHTFLVALRQLSIADQLNLLKEYVIRCNNNTYLCCEDYNVNIVKSFNTAVDTVQVHDKMYQEFVYLSFQNPLDVVTKIIKHGVVSDFQAQIMGDILAVLHPLHTLNANSSSFPSIVMQVLFEIMETHRNLELKESSFISLIVFLVSRNVVSTSDYLKICLLPLLHKSVLDESWLSLNFWLQIVQVFIDGTITSCEFCHSSELLLVLSEILEKSRKNFSSFSGISMTVSEKVFSLLAIIVESMPFDIKEENSLTNVRENLLKSSSPVNIFYFYDLWSTCDKFPEVVIDEKVLLLHGMNLHKWNLQQEFCFYKNGSRNTLVFDLIQLLPSSTQSEWKHITQNLLSMLSPTSVCTSPESVFDIFIDAIQIIMSMQSSPELSEEEKDCALSCIDFCVRNFAVIVKEEIVGQLHSISAADAGGMFQKIVHFYHQLPDVIQDSCAGLILNVQVDLILFAISEMQIYSNHDDEEEAHCVKTQCEEVFKLMINSLTLVQNNKSRQALAHKIQEGFEMIIR